MTIPDSNSQEGGKVELLPCPFCGERLTANTNQADLYVQRYGTHYEHRENGCHLSGDEVSPSQIASWNTRPTPSQEGRSSLSVEGLTDERIKELAEQQGSWGACYGWTIESDFTKPYIPKHAYSFARAIEKELTK